MTLLCVVSLLLAAAMFPATGFGDYPDWSPSGVAPGGSDAPETGPGTGGDDSSGGGTATGDGGTATPESGTTTDAGGETTGVTTDETTGEKGTTTTTDTTSTTTTSTTTDDTTGDDSDDEALLGGLWSLVGTLLAALLLGSILASGIGTLVLLGLVIGVIEIERPSETELVLDVWGLPSMTIPLSSTVAGVPQATTAFLVGFGGTLPAVLDDLSELGAGMTTGVGALLSGLGRAAGQVVTGFPGAMAAVGSGLATTLGGSLLAIPGGLSSIATGLSNPFGKDGNLPGSDARDAAGVPDPDRTDEAAEDLPPQSVEEAWAKMTGGLPVRNRDAKTPAELARIAVERGLPEEAVTRLTAVFREVRYGPAGSTPRHLEIARSAIERIQDDPEGE